MNRLVFPALCAVVLTVQFGCGAEPQATPDIAFPGQRLQAIPFSGLADPASGRMQLVAAPQAAFGIIPEDNNGSPTTVTVNTAQIYGPSVVFTNTLPTGCTANAATYLTSDVEVFSGFTEQLRNVYAKLTTVSGGQTFCTGTVPTNSNFTGSGSLTPNLGLYRYDPLSGGAGTNIKIRQTLPWAMNLPNLGPFWFSGELWAEVIPLPPTITAPTSGQVLHTAGSTRSVTFSWINDPLANGTNPDGNLVPRPSFRAVSAQVNIFRCGAATGPYDPASCSTTAIFGPSNQRSGFSTTLAAGWWYLAKFNSRFRIANSTVIGTLSTTQYFQVVTP